jgi:serine/threonine protein kinase
VRRSDIYHRESEKTFSEKKREGTLLRVVLFRNRRRQIGEQDFAKHVFCSRRLLVHPIEMGFHMSKTDWSPLQKLWEDGEFILSRAVTPGGSEARLLLVPASERPSPATIRQLEYLYSLRQKLDSAWFARPLAIGSQDQRPALLLEDPGGILLGQTLARPPELQLTLRIGIGVASALGCLHARGLIHRNLNPDNVFVDLPTGEARLVGPYIALRAPGEGFQAPGPISTTLAFLAPEQTGRMNRSTDSRSDLYAYGVMLYRMVTGVFPFGAKNPTEWIHSHLAVQPMPPDQRSKTVPAQLSAIVMKLLAKMPEERYQTAAGVEKDLRICLERVESGRQIAPFPLGMHDIPDELLISEKLYGRDSQIDALLTAYRGRWRLVVSRNWCWSQAIPGSANPR